MSSLPIQAKELRTNDLVVFSGLDGGNAGGIQAAGRLAWEALRERPNIQLLSFGSVPQEIHVDERQRATVAESRFGAIKGALRQPRIDGILLVWHLGLLKLLPFLSKRHARVVVFLHGVECWRAPSPLLRRQLSRVNLFLSNTHFTWQRFCIFHPCCKHTDHATVHLGMGDSFAAPPPDPSREPIAVMLGRMQRAEDYKGHREVIAAWREVLRIYPSAKLWILGDGDLRQDLEQLAKNLAVSTSIKFWGRVDEQRKHQCLAQARCLALPSRGEGFGLVYLEAMRLGRPCLVSNCDAGVEVVDPPTAGLSVDPQDPSQVAAGLVRLLTPGDEWNAWSRQAKARFDQQFTASAFKSRLMAALFPGKYPPASDPSQQ